MKSHVVEEFFDLGFVKFAPHVAEHDLGNLSETWIVIHVFNLEIQTNAFLCVVLLNILSLFLFVGSLPAGFFLFFQPRVNIIFEETHLQKGKRPEFVNVKNLVAFGFLGCKCVLQGFLSWSI